MSYICMVTCMKPKPTIGLKYFPEKTVGQVQSVLIAKIGRPTAPWYENSVSCLIITILPHPQARTRIHSHAQPPLQAYMHILKNTSTLALIFALNKRCSLF